MPTSPACLCQGRTLVAYTLTHPSMGLVDAVVCMRRAIRCMHIEVVTFYGSVHKYFRGSLEWFTSSTSKKVDPPLYRLQQPQPTRVNERQLGIVDSDFQKIFKDIEIYVCDIEQY